MMRADRFFSYRLEYQQVIEINTLVSVEQFFCNWLSDNVLCRIVLKMLPAIARNHCAYISRMDDEFVIQ